MRLQRVKAREYKGEPIYKWQIVIPPKDIEKLGWTEGMELQGNVADELYLLKPKP
ncbi:MAG: hypothetical protein R6U10_00970 [Thermoplasmatota archaeon]